MADQPLIITADFTSTHTFSTDDVTGTFSGLMQSDIEEGDAPIVDFTAQPTITKEGVSLYPIDSEFGFYVTDFLGAEDKIRDYDYGEGFVGDLTGPAGEQLGLVVSDAPTDTFQTPAVLGTWLAGLGGNTVKASTEHYAVMQQVLSDQQFPDDPDAVYTLDDDLILLSQNEAWNEQRVADLLGDPDTFGVTDRNEDGVVDLKDLLNPNESTIAYDIAYSSDYSITLKDDGKLLYRWGNLIKRPNDVRIEADLDLPEEWSVPDTISGLMPLFQITAAELVTDHTVTNNPNDQIRPEDYENEAAIGQLPTYAVVTDYNLDGNGPREVWVSTDDYYAGDGTLYPAGTILKDAYLAQKAAESGLNAISAADEALLEGFTNEWFTTMDREPFEAALDDAGEYISGPRWRLQPDKYGQDLPSVVIPIDPSDPLPVTSDEAKYEVGTDTTTVINLLDWGLPVSPLATSAGWANNSGMVTENGVNLSDDFDVAFYIKGDIKPATIYDTTLLLQYEQIAIADEGASVLGGAEEDYLVGQGANTFTGGAESDLFVLSYGKTSEDDYDSSTINDFVQGEDVIGLFDLGLTEGNFDRKIEQVIDSGNLLISVDGDQIAQLQSVTEELEYEDFLLLNREFSVDEEGTSGDDLLIGSPNDDILSGLEGNDTLLGMSGSDELLGGDDDDVLLAEAVDDSFDEPAGQTFRLYETAFDRTPDRPGHLMWTNMIADGAMDLTDVVDAFVGSAEYDALYAGTTNEEFVTKLYENALDRTPDAGGLAAWVAALDAGTLTRAEVLVGFSESTELQNNSEAPGLMFSQAGYHQAFTDDAYRLFVATNDAEPDDLSFEEIASDLTEGDTAAAVSAELLDSTASQTLYAGTTDAEFVETLYQTTLERAADAPSLTVWTDALGSGAITRADVVVAVAQSNEARTKLADDLVDHMRDLGQDDLINGGADDDVLFGGMFSDTFVFDAADAGSDQLIGLEAWDTMQFNGFGYATAADAIAQMSQVGDDVVFSDAGVTVTQLDIELGTITDDMILV